MKLLEGIAKRLVWYFERMRPYPKRYCSQQLFCPIVPSSNKCLAILATPSQAFDALWTAWSWIRFFRDFQLIFWIDGKIPDSFSRRANDVFPGCQVQDISENSPWRQVLKTGFASLISHHPLGRKLQAIVQTQRNVDLIYADFDVLALNAPFELQDSLSRGIPSFIQEPNGAPFDPWVIERAKTLGKAVVPSLNSGLFSIPRGTFDTTFLEMFFESWSPPASSWFTEQSAFSVLFGPFPAGGLPCERYIASTRRQFPFERDVTYNHLAARHFITPVRHLMYLKGYPYLCRQTQNNVRKTAR